MNGVHFIQSECVLHSKLSGVLAYTMCRGFIINVILYISDVYFTGLHETLNLGVWASFILTNETVALTEKERPHLPEGIDIKPEVRTECCIIIVLLYLV